MPDKQFSIKGADLQHYKRTEAYAKMIDRIYNQAISAFASIAAKAQSNIDPQKAFNLNDYPAFKEATKKILDTLSKKMKVVIDEGTSNEWLSACKKNDDFLKSILDTTKVPKKTLKKWQDRNLDALGSFQNRKTDGMDLSQRIWKQTQQARSTIELSIDVALGEGKSAAQLATELKQNLVDPSKLFRRVRDKYGNLQLSKAAKAYHPGQGKYRSSYKNALRLTRSEINMSYATSDGLRWQALDFVTGFEVKRSAHEYDCDVCDKLKGKYPKTFEWKKWHPQCRCYAVPILMSRDEFNTDELNELKAAFKGTEYKKFSSQNEITDVPQGFKDWVNTNTERSNGWASQPYFVRDNFDGGTLAGGLKLAVSSPVLNTPPPPPIVVLDPIEEFKNQVDAVNTFDDLRRIATNGFVDIGYNVKMKFYQNDVDLATTKVYLKKLYDLCNEYKIELPFISIKTRQNQGSYGYIEPLKADGTRANYQSEIKAVGINVGKRTDQRRLDPYATGKSLCDPENIQISTLVHEFGHMLNSDYNKSSIANAFRNEIYSIYKSYVSDLYSYRTNSPEFRSIYLGSGADISIHEFIAEAFQEYKNRRASSKYAKRVGTLMDQYFLKKP